jgi:hypothetical protein
LTLRVLARAGLLALALTTVTAACGQGQASFDPNGPCDTDGRTPGAYPDLEAKLPPALGGVGPADGVGGATADLAPTTIDSGRNCSQQALSTLAEHGVSELRFAGATWDAGGGDGTVSAYFTTPPGQPALEAGWMEEFYATGARASTKTENIEIMRPTMGPAGEVFRLDTINDLSLQSVVVWPASDGVRVVIVATRVDPNASKPAHDAAVELAVMQSVTRTQP